MKKQQNINQSEETHIEKNVLKMGKIELSTRSVFLIYAAFFLIFSCTLIYCVSSCTRQIAITYIKELGSQKKSTNNQ